jgi:hypothetical protein
VGKYKNAGPSLYFPEDMEPWGKSKKRGMWDGEILHINYNMKFQDIIE